MILKLESGWKVLNAKQPFAAWHFHFRFMPTSISPHYS